MLGITAACGAGALVWWEGDQRYPTTGAHASIAAVIVVTAIAMVALGRARQKERTSTWIGCSVQTLLRWRERPAAIAAAAVWAVLFAAVVGWDLNSFVHQAHDLPTLSRIIGAVTHASWGRSLVFALWCALGGTIAGANRRPAR